MILNFAQEWQFRIGKIILKLVLLFQTNVAIWRETWQISERVFQRVPSRFHGYFEKVPWHKKSFCQCCLPRQGIIHTLRNQF